MEPTSRGQNDPPLPGSYFRINHTLAKRDFLLSIEKEITNEWEQMRLWQTDAPSEGDEPKYMVTFPCPYMDGRLTLGHAFTISKAEFAAGYHRLW
jgi:leucyl-tRNA synthetase